VNLNNGGYNNNNKTNQNSVFVGFEIYLWKIGYRFLMYGWHTPIAGLEKEILEPVQNLRETN
jgi:hypothetical protein